MRIIQNMYGFLIRILPCAYFCLYPFTDCFRFDKKNVYGFTGAVSAGMAALLAGAALCPRHLADRRFFLQDIIFCLTLALLFGMYVYSIRAGLFQKLFVFLVLMNYEFLISLTDSIYAGIFAAVTDRCRYTAANVILITLINVLLFYPMKKLIKAICRILESPMEKRLWQQFTLLPALFILLACAALKTARLCTDKQSYLICLFILWMMLIFALAAYYCILRIMETARKNAIEQSRLETALKNYRKNAENIHHICEIRHETKHHINALNLYLKNKDYDGAEKYLARFSQIAAEIPAAEYTPHPLLNSMLADYKERAKLSCIPVTYQISAAGQIAMDDTDLCCLLSNLMDNAIEGCGPVEASRRHIRLTIRQNGNFLFFACENSCDASLLAYQDGILASTKSRTKTNTHGYGISILNKIAEKYNGAFQTKTEKDTFTAIANLCLTNETKEILKNVPDRYL